MRYEEDATTRSVYGKSLIGLLVDEETPSPREAQDLQEEVNPKMYYPWIWSALQDLSADTNEAVRCCHDRRLLEIFLETFEEHVLGLVDTIEAALRNIRIDRLAKRKGE